MIWYFVGRTLIAGVRKQSEKGLKKYLELREDE
jgi:hypothetical protein